MWLRCEMIGSPTFVWTLVVCGPCCLFQQSGCYTPWTSRIFTKKMYVTKHAVSLRLLSIFGTLTILSLFLDVALKWLRKIHASARNEIYDSFFVKGPPTEVIQGLVPALSEKENSKEDHRAFCLNLERWYS